MAQVVRWFVYLAECADGSLYAGVTRDLVRRIEQHSAGKGARYTRARRPVQLYASQAVNSHGKALRLELAVKALPRERKLALADPAEFRRLSRAVSHR